MSLLQLCRKIERERNGIRGVILSQVYIEIIPGSRNLQQAVSQCGIVPAPNVAGQRPGCRFALLEVALVIISHSLPSTNLLFTAFGCAGPCSDDSDFAFGYWNIVRSSDLAIEYHHVELSI